MITIAWIFVGFIIGLAIGLLYQTSQVEAQIKLRKEYEEAIRNIFDKYWSKK